MIAPIRQSAQKSKSTSLHEKFLAMLPQIQRQAQFAFRRFDPDAREELTQETVVNAFCAFARLVAQGKEAVAYPASLAGYAIRQVHSGRRVVAGLKRRDILSAYARANGITIERLDRFREQDGEWLEALVEDKTAGPAEIAAARIDVAAWLRSLSTRNRRIATLLASGEKTTLVSRKFHLSRGARQPTAQLAYGKLEWFP